MAQLRTYDREELSVIGSEYGEDVPTEPGQLVSHVDFRDSTFGTIVAIDDHHAEVLWSRGPFIVDVGQTLHSGGYLFAPYVPLQVTPTFLNVSGSQPNRLVRYAKKLVNPGFFVSGSFV